MIRALIIKDLKRKMSNPAGFLLLMALPLVFTFLMGLVFTSSGSKPELPKINLLIKDNDNSYTSRMFIGAFQQGELGKMFIASFVGQDSGKALMDEGKASALIIIPQGFQDSLLQQKTSVVTLVKNPSQAYLPKIAQETADILCKGTEKLYRLAGSQFNTIQTMIKSDHWPELDEMGALYLEFKDSIDKVSGFIFPPIIELDKEILKNPQEEEKNSGNIILAYILTGIAAMSIFFVLEALGHDFYREREQSTLFRIAASPVGIKKFLLSKQIFMILMGNIAFLIVWLIGVLLFNIRLYLSDIPGFILLSVILITALTGIIVFLFSILKSRSMGSQINPAVIIFFSLLGGGMVPLQSLPVFIKKVAVISPIFWGVDGLQKILIDHQPFSHYQTHLFVLLLLAIIFNTLAFINFNRKLKI